MKLAEKKKPKHYVYIGPPIASIGRNMLTPHKKKIRREGCCDVKESLQ